MSFTSDLRGLTIIDDSNAAKYAAQAGASWSAGSSVKSFSGGYTPRPYEKHPFASYARGFSGKTIPRNEWADRIKERQERKATLRGLHKQLKIPVLNQNGLPYCWFYGLTAGMMLGYGRAGFKVPHLSATSCAAKIKGYRKEGGWAGEGIEGLKKYGYRRSSIGLNTNWIASTTLPSNEQTRSCTMSLSLKNSARTPSMN